MRAFTKEWIKAALDDLVTIEEIIENHHLTHIVAFHSQQCIEKLMKALMEEKEIDTPKIHKLIKLKELLGGELDELDETLLSTLDQLYIESRYPGELGLLPNGKPSLEEAREFYNFTRDIFEKICQKLSIKKNELI